MPSYRGREFTFQAEPSARAWDAADAYVLSHLEELLAKLPAPESADAPRVTLGRVLLINDHGPVTTALAGESRDVWADSFLVRQTVRQNLERNAVPETEVRFLSLDAFVNPLADGEESNPPEPGDQNRLASSSTSQDVGSRMAYDFVLLRAPRERELLQCQIRAIRPFLTANARVIAYGMTKHMFPDLREMLSQSIAPTKVTAVVKHAVLVIAEMGAATTASVVGAPAATTANGAVGAPAATTANGAVGAPATTTVSAVGTAATAGNASHETGSGGGQVPNVTPTAATSPETSPARPRNVAAPKLYKSAPCSPQTFTAELPSGNVTVHTLPGTFSHGELDPGTRLLLGHLPTPGPDAVVVDLGCGSGILGLALLRVEPRLSLHLVDESMLALLSARKTLAANGVVGGAIETASPDRAKDTASAPQSDDTHDVPTGVAPRFHFNDGLLGFDEGSVDLVVSNPPFHRQGVFDVAETRRLLRQAHRALRPGGELRLVAVHGASVERELRTLFASTERIVSERRFGIYKAIR